ncbi:MBL fold metallo-hydrolase [Bacillus stercoris]|nr:MBL fold metallo-hydrolase [Bacillus stercoris]
MLNFIGTGSAFNTKLGNNSAFIKKDNSLFLIDCGSTTFSRLKETGLLEDVEKVFVLLTHTHADHVGSLGDLILYGYYSMGKLGVPNVSVYSPFSLNIKNLLYMQGVFQIPISCTSFMIETLFNSMDLIFTLKQ